MYNTKQTATNVTFKTTDIILKITIKYAKI